MKIIVIGSVIFSKSIIEYLMRRKIKINGIIGKKSSSFNSDYFDIVNYFKKKRHKKSVYIQTISTEKNLFLDYKNQARYNHMSRLVKVIKKENSKYPKNRNNWLSPVRFTKK